jgi:hypothetical protein
MTKFYCPRNVCARRSRFAKRSGATGQPRGPGAVAPGGIGRAKPLLEKKKKTIHLFLKNPADSFDWQGLKSRSEAEAMKNPMGSGCDLGDRH